MTLEEKRAYHNAYMKAWKARNREKVRAIQKACEEKKPEIYRAMAARSQSRRRAENPEKFKAAEKKYRQTHKVECRSRTKAWIATVPNYYMLNNAKNRARKEGLPFAITLADLSVPEFCPVLGIKLGNYRGQGTGGFKDDAPSLDRIIPSKGYVKSNIKVISNRANAIKRDATAAELRAIADYIDREVSLSAIRFAASAPDIYPEFCAEIERTSVEVDRNLSANLFPPNAEGESILAKARRRAPEYD